MTEAAAHPGSGAQRLSDETARPAAAAEIRQNERMKGGRPVRSAGFSHISVGLPLRTGNAGAIVGVPRSKEERSQQPESSCFALVSIGTWVEGGMEREDELTRVVLRKAGRFSSERLAQHSHLCWDASMLQWLIVRRTHPRRKRPGRTGK